MDQAHIRALVSGISSFVTGLPRSWIGDHRGISGAHKKISRVPLNRASVAALRIRQVCDRMGPYAVLLTGIWRPMSQMKPHSSRAMAAVTLL
jgi:hypothetical protein